MSSNGNKLSPMSFTASDVNRFPPKFDSSMATETNNIPMQSSDKGYFYKEGKFLNHKGLGWFLTGLFLVGDLAGKYC